MGAVQSLESDGGTCLYDALYVAVNRTAIQEGAKCVIAFTDGKDNRSSNTKDSVIELANRYSIPIYIIGVGSDIETYSLENIANSTGGFYRHIYGISDLQEIYDTIYREQKALYVAEYTLGDSENTADTRYLSLSYAGDEVGGTYEYSYRPQLIMDVEHSVSGLSEVDDIIGEYLRAFVKDINANDFNYLAPTMEEGSPIYKTQSAYVEKTKATESLISYEIVDKQYDNNGFCHVKVRETYQIENYKEPIHITIFENTYSVREQTDGSWLLYDLEDLQVISKTAN